MINIVCPTVKHSLKYFFTGSSGLPNVSEVIGVGAVDGCQVGYCDSSNNIVEPRQDWMKKIFDNNPQQWKWYTDHCFEIQPSFFRARIFSLSQQFNQSGGAVFLLDIMSDHYKSWDMFKQNLVIQNCFVDQELN